MFLVGKFRARIKNNRCAIFRAAGDGRLDAVILRYFDLGEMRFAGYYLKHRPAPVFPEEGA